MKMFAKMYKYWQKEESTEAHLCSGEWGGGYMKKLTSLYRKSRDRIKAVCSRKGGGVTNQRLKVRPINISPPNSKKRE